MKGTLTGRCASCREHHSADSMCPPHEVRATGHTWFLVYVVELEAKVERLQEKCFNDAMAAKKSGYEEGRAEVERLQGLLLHLIDEGMDDYWATVNAEWVAVTRKAAEAARGNDG